MFVCGRGRRMTDKRIRLTADDIGLPENFRHVFQLAWNEDGELKLRDSVDPELKDLFRMDGITHGHSQDDKIKEFLVKFFQKKERMTELRKRISRPAPPPPPPPAPFLPQKKRETTRSPPTEIPPNATASTDPLPSPQKVEATTTNETAKKSPPPPPPIGTGLQRLPVPAPRSKLTQSSSFHQPTSRNPTNQTVEDVIYDVPKKFTKGSAAAPANKEENQENISEDDIINILCDYIAKRGGMEKIKNDVLNTQTNANKPPLNANQTTRPKSLGNQLDCGNSPDTTVSHTHSASTSTLNTV